MVVLIKEVPDTYRDRVLSLETGLLERDASDRVLDETSERALEAAISYADAHEDIEVIALTVAPEAAHATVRKALAIGAHRAVLVADAELLGADLTLTAVVLAAALQRIGFDLVLAGNQSTDGSAGVIPAMLAEILSIPQLTALDSIEIGKESVGGERFESLQKSRLNAPLPAIASVTERLPEARFPNFKAILAAKKKPFEILSLADLGLDTDVASVPRSIMTQVRARPARVAGQRIVDEGDAGTQLAEFLLKNRLA